MSNCILAHTRSVIGGFVVLLLHGGTGVNLVIASVVTFSGRFELHGRHAARQVMMLLLMLLLRNHSQSRLLLLLLSRQHLA